jgi:AmmeMemoRadiSam system protein B
MRPLIASIREPACVGCYPGNPEQLRDFFRELFTHPRASGLPADVRPDGSLVGALVPHIDYGRGGLTYTWAFREIVEKSSASLFVILATSHYSSERFILTRQHFATPLGVTETDQDFINQLEALYGPGLFEDPLAHVPEHSIELEVVLLQYLFEGRRPIRIVPLLIGSFGDCVHFNQTPADAPDIDRMILALRRSHAIRKEPICYLISGDLAHLGPKFRDPEPVTESQLEHSKQKDLALMRAAEAADIQDYFKVIESEKDRRRICGFPPTWTFLQAIQPSAGKLLHYDQFVDPGGTESVSFASMTFSR